jgi:hypothetical protein
MNSDLAAVKERKEAALAKFRKGQARSEAERAQKESEWQALVLRKAFGEQLDRIEAKIDKLKK